MGFHGSKHINGNLGCAVVLFVAIIICMGLHELVGELWLPVFVFLIIGAGAVAYAWLSKE
jgi:hypothetical protein